MNRTEQIRTLNQTLPEEMTEYRQSALSKMRPACDHESAV